jgi:hypothetical protein
LLDDFAQSEVLSHAGAPERPHCQPTWPVRVRYMMKKPGWLPGLLVGLATGCVTRTTIHDEPRENTSFASLEAAQGFYDAYHSVLHFNFLPPPYRGAVKEGSRG